MFLVMLYTAFIFRLPAASSASLVNLSIKFFRSFLTDLFTSLCFSLYICGAVVFADIVLLLFNVALQTFLSLIFVRVSTLIHSLFCLVLFPMMVSHVSFYTFSSLPTVVPLWCLHHGDMKVLDSDWKGQDGTLV